MCMFLLLKWSLFAIFHGERLPDLTVCFIDCPQALCPSYTPFSPSLFSVNYSETRAHFPAAIAIRCLPLVFHEMTK